MRIAQLAPLVESVPPTGYGGIELVVSLLTEELCRRGHEVTLFASGDSVTNANLVSVVDKPLRKHLPDKPHLWHAFDYRALLQLEALSGEVDIIHNHMGWQALPFLAKMNVPVVTTNHNLIEPAVAPIYAEYKRLPFVGISRAYVNCNLPDTLNYVDVVYNGIEVNKFSFYRSHERTYLCFLGRLCVDKGIVEAIQIAKRIGLPLKVAGKVDPNDKSYFESEVAHLLDDPLIDYIGEVNHEQKVELLGGAIALVYPINFEEPFGLVMAEALACGVPVLAIDRGSVREVLSDETAVIGHSIDELVERFPEVLDKSRDACRKRAEDLFTERHMTDRYESLYAQLIPTSARQVMAPPRLSIAS